MEHEQGLIPDVDRQAFQRIGEEGWTPVTGEARSWSPREAEDGGPRPFQLAPASGARVGYGVETEDRRRFAVTLTCEPVLAAGAPEPVARYLRETVRELRGDPRGSARVDAQALKQLETLKFRRGLALLAEESVGYGVMPVSWRFVAEQPAAFSASGAGVRARLDPHERLIAELTDIPSAVGPGAVRATVRRISGARRAVYLRLPPDSEALALASRSGARGVVLSADGVGSGAQIERLAALVRRARDVVRFVVLDRVRPDLTAEAFATGATHVVTRPNRLPSE